MKKQTRKIIVAFFTVMFFAFFFSLIGLCVLFYGLLVKKCLPGECAPKRNFAVTDLSIPGSFFPSTATVGAFNSPSESFGAVESAIMNVFWRQGEGGSVYIVQRFATIEQAQRFLNALRSDGIFPASPDISYRSSTADSYYVGCGYSQFGGERCQLLARYDEFVVEFNVTIDNLMTIQKFEGITIFIDSQISKRLTTP